MKGNTMMTSRFEQIQESGSLALAGELIVDHAAELRKVLLDAFANIRSLVLVMNGVTRVDMFGLQVLCAAHQFAQKAGKELTLAHPQPEALRDAVVLSGYGHGAQCSKEKNCPWNGD